MNERINDLVDKTADMLPGVYTVMYESGKKGVEFNEEALNKFVELIVQECMRMCDVAQVGYLTHGYTLQSYGCQGAKRYIAEWFEVEE